jgi:hypothetical protein
MLRPVSQRDESNSSAREQCTALMAVNGAGLGNLK